MIMRGIHFINTIQCFITWTNLNGNTEQVYDQDPLRLLFPLR
jgi:hypothetical protein